jgi:hypothetical protein
MDEIEVCGSVCDEVSSLCGFTAQRIHSSLYFEVHIMLRKRGNAMRAYGRLEVKLHVSLISVLDVGGWLVSRLGRFTARYLLNRGEGVPRTAVGC